jgi:hypothetical protein
MLGFSMDYRSIFVLGPEKHFRLEAHAPWITWQYLAEIHELELECLEIHNEICDSPLKKLQ